MLGYAEAPLKNEVAGLMARLAELKNRVLKNDLSREKTGQERNMIRQAVQDLLGSVSR